MSLSLIAVFLPILLMPGIVGLLFHEFAVTLSIAILLSLVISLTVTPTMCAYVLKREQAHASQATLGALDRSAVRALQECVLALADRRARPCARWSSCLLIGLLVLNVFLVRLVPSTFFPEQDTGILIGQIIADQSISFHGDGEEARATAGDRAERPGGRVGGRLHRRPRAQHRQRVHRTQAAGASATCRPPQVVNRLRPKLNAVSGARLFLQAQQDLQIGGRQSAAEYQYTLTSDDPSALFKWVPKLVTELGKYRGQLDDVNSDLQQNGLQILREHQPCDGDALWLRSRTRSTTCLYDAFGQRTVSTIYNALNQYFVVMEVAPKYWQYPQIAQPDLPEHGGRQSERHAADADARRHRCAA